MNIKEAGIEIEKIERFLVDVDNMIEACFTVSQINNAVNWCNLYIKKNFMDNKDVHYLLHDHILNTSKQQIEVINKCIEDNFNRNKNKDVIEDINFSEAKIEESFNNIYEIAEQIYDSYMKKIGLDPSDTLNKINERKKLAKKMGIVRR